jgi:nucleoside 2-deoxyribosyltransferase
MNRLKGLRCYLAGPIDYADDDGVGWRNKATLWLEQKGVAVMDPCNKPTLDTEYKEIEEEKIKLMDLKDQEDYEGLTKIMKPIAHVDLRMLDRSDFVIVYIDMEAKPFGTIWELKTALDQRKPTLVMVEGGKNNVSNWIFGVMNHNWIFGSWGDLFQYLHGINGNTIDADLTRWVFFEQEE